MISMSLDVRSSFNYQAGSAKNCLTVVFFILALEKQEKESGSSLGHTGS